VTDTRATALDVDDRLPLQSARTELETIHFLDDENDEENDR